MLPPRRLLPLVATLRTLPLADRHRVLGQLILGAPGSGKTVLLSFLLLFDLLRGLPGCVLDPLGTLSDAFLFRLAWFLSEFPQGDDELLWQRLRYIELGGDSVTPFPIYYQPTARGEPVGSRQPAHYRVGACQPAACDIPPDLAGSKEAWGQCRDAFNRAWLRRTHGN